MITLKEGLTRGGGEATTLRIEKSVYTARGPIYICGVCGVGGEGGIWLTEQGVYKLVNALLDALAMVKDGDG